MGDWTLFAAPPRPNPNVFVERPPELGGLSVLELRDANAECAHGRCAFDPSPPCGCHTIEKGGPVTELPAQAESREKAA